MSLRSPLHDVHGELGARMVGFGGWEMPLQYTSVLGEHRAVRESAGLFDVSHLGKIVVEGSGAEAFLDGLLPGPVAALEPGRAGYNLLLNDSGGIVDDIFVYRGREDFLCVPNAANFDAVMQAMAGGRAVGVDATDARRKWAILALSGPRAREIAAEVFGPDVSKLKLHRFADVEWNGTRVRVGRTGYTGEVTFELFVPWEDARDAWKAVLHGGEGGSIVPAGLGARDTLRLEMGYPLHGHDISDQTNPVEAGLGWVIEWEKPSFTGRDALLRVRESGPGRRLVGLIASEKKPLRDGCFVLSGDQRVGEVTSGNVSPTLGVGIGLAYVTNPVAEPGTDLSVDVRGRRVPVMVIKPPFVGR